MPDPEWRQGLPVRLRSSETLAQDWYSHQRYVLDIDRADGSTQRVARVSVHRGDRAAVLLHCPDTGNVVLTCQFRLPTFLAGDLHGHLLEVPGGLLDGATAAEGVQLEAEEETGFLISSLRRVCTVYLAPQLSKERTHLFTGEYDPSTRVGPGGGVASEGEEVHVLELPLREALDRVQKEEAADAKTLLLLLHAQSLQLRAR